MELSEEEITKLHTIRKITLKMLKDRDYLISDLEINMSKQDFINIYGDDLKKEHFNLHKAKKDNAADQIYVFFPAETKFGVKAIKAYVTRLYSENIFRAIIVLQQAPTSFAKTCIDEVSSKFHLEIFLEAELMVNITQHELVPEHRVLTDTEKKILLERYTVKETQLPRIQMNDPVSKYYGLKRGQVVKIIRSSETGGRYVTYRLVV